MAQATTVMGFSIQQRFPSVAKDIATFTAFPPLLVNLCLSYCCLIIPGDLARAKELPVLHFTAEDLTRLCQGTYGFAYQDEQDAGVSVLGRVKVPRALNLSPQKMKGEWSIRAGQPKTKIGFYQWVERESLPRALQTFERCTDIRIREGIDDTGPNKRIVRAFEQIGIDQTDQGRDEGPRTLRKVLEKTRFVFVRYSNQQMPKLQETRYLRVEGVIGSYYDCDVQPEDILPISAPEVDGSPELLSLNLGQTSAEVEGWKKILIAQYRTSMIVALRDPEGFFARDYLEGTEGAKERDAFVAKYLK